MKQLELIIQNLPEFAGLFKNEDTYTVKLYRNLIKATIVEIRPNGKNYDLKFVQRIGRVWCPSKKINKEPRNITIATVDNVPLNKITSKYNWIMGRNNEPEII